MIIKTINYGYKKLPERAHYNDAGADVRSMIDYSLAPGETVKIPLGYGLRLPDGLAAFVMPRSGLSSKGIACEIPPIDSGYTGEVHAIVTNNGTEFYQILKGDRVGQLVIVPFITGEFVDETLHDLNQRGSNGFGSTGTN